MANNQLLASDNFASGSLAAGWSALHSFSACQVVGSGSSAVTEANTLSTQAGQVWTGLTWTNDHVSEITVGALTSTGTNIIVLNVRMQPNANSGYQLNIQNQTGTLVSQIYKVTGGGTSLLSSVSIGAVSAGDVFSFQAAGSCLLVYKNGSLVQFVYDATYASGTPGFGCYATSSVANCQVS